MTARLRVRCFFFGNTRLTAWRRCHGDRASCLSPKVVWNYAEEGTRRQCSLNKGPEEREELPRIVLLARRSRQNSRAGSGWGGGEGGQGWRSGLGSEVRGAEEGPAWPSVWRTARVERNLIRLIYSSWLHYSFRCFFWFVFCLFLLLVHHQRCGGSFLYHFELSTPSFPGDCPRTSVCVRFLFKYTCQVLFRSRPRRLFIPVVTSCTAALSSHPCL